MRRPDLQSAPAFLAAALIMMAGSANASSDAAWEEHDRAVIEQCQDASHFPDAAPAGEPVLFDDEAGMTALLIQGHYSKNDSKNDSKNGGPQTHMNGQAGQELCLFLRSSQEVYIADADKLAIGSDALPSTPTDAINDSTETTDTSRGQADQNADTP